MPQEQPESVAQDGPTTCQRRDRPVLMVHTGGGKGKSTAAFGLALRGRDQGGRTGCRASSKLPEAVHPVIKMTCTEHPMDVGQKVQRRIEW